jgi:UDP-glucose 4-epimerase
MTILVTGGAGYIGSHTVRELQRAGQPVVVYDNLTKGHRPAVPAGVKLIEGDIRDQGKLARAIAGHNVGAVVHFAASSLVGESMKEPSAYYNNNVAGTLALLDTMLAGGVKKVVFSSTAAVYGEPAAWPIGEDMPTAPTNVYGRTKLAIEHMLADFAAAYGLVYVSLRYFNAAGASEDGTVGEDHSPETHLIPLVLQAALGQREAVAIFGTDYPTDDGTCIRDYIHVTDLAAAHVKALQHLAAGGASKVYNLGSETGYSVRQVIDRAKAITGVDFHVREEARRPGDPAVLVASSRRIAAELGWRPRLSDLDAIIATAWNWHKNHPAGFADTSHHND